MADSIWKGFRWNGTGGMNSVFVMTHKEIDIAKMAGHKWTYAWVVIDYQPLKEDPNRIRIAVGGNLIKYREKSARLISQQALNVMTMQEALTPPSAFTPRTFVPIGYENNVLNFAHFALSMAHPTTGETISSYKRLMNDPETAKIWQKAFGTQRDDNARSTYTPIGFHPTNIRTHSIQKQCPKFCALCVADGTSDHGRNHIKLQTVHE